MKPANMELASPAGQCRPAASDATRLVPCKQKPVARWKQLAAGWDKAIHSIVADGYEDERGFHYGRQPMPREANSCE